MTAESGAYPLDEYGYPVVCFPDCGNRKPDGSECAECQDGHAEAGESRG